MDHDVVVRQKMTERYLLNELDSESRDEFEEHFFDCPECAFDVRAGSAFVEQSKNVLAETREAEMAPASSPTPAPASGGWLAWLRPAFAAPALALLLAVVGYQNLVTYPQLQQALNRPQVLPWAPVNVGTLGIWRARDCSISRARVSAVCADPAGRQLLQLHSRPV